MQTHIYHIHVCMLAVWRYHISVPVLLSLIISADINTQDDSDEAQPQTKPLDFLCANPQFLVMHQMVQQTLQMLQPLNPAAAGQLSLTLN